MSFVVKIDWDKLSGLIVSQPEADLKYFQQALSESKLLSPTQIAEATALYANDIKGGVALYLKPGVPWVYSRIGHPDDLGVTMVALMDTIFTANGWPLDERTKKIQDEFLRMLVAGYRRNAYYST